MVKLCLSFGFSFTSVEGKLFDLSGWKQSCRTSGISMP